eukprot:576394-Hanusia_phi.AAC.6
MPLLKAPFFGLPSSSKEATLHVCAAWQAYRLECNAKRGAVMGVTSSLHHLKGGLESQLSDLPVRSLGRGGGGDFTPPLPLERPYPLQSGTGTARVGLSKGWGAG